MREVNIIFPNQLFKLSSLEFDGINSYLIEEELFFKEFNFHKIKLVLHRSSMKYYEQFLKNKGHSIQYLDLQNPLSNIANLFKKLADDKVEKVNIIDPVDDLLIQKLYKYSEENMLKINILNSPGFMTTSVDLDSFFHNKKSKFYHTSFYVKQRKSLKILLNDDGGPEGGKWSFDSENRKKYPKDKIPPKFKTFATNSFYDEAVIYINKNFKNNFGDIPNNPIYPHDYESSERWLEVFLEERFYDFGVYEDAIVESENFLNHSVLTPMLNIGLLTPDYIISKTLKYSETHEVPLNSVEGFVRQIVGWREFIRGVYIAKGKQQRTSNFFNFKNKIPDSFYDGSTGIHPIDSTIKKIIKTGYCHHIERLMVLGNFMLICEFEPDDIYRWFMEVFVDSYDWVMVPNVYGMSQFADGGLMATKPYLSSSNYIKKMSNYKKSNWEAIWDALYWRFINKQKETFSKNIRMKFMVNIYNKMSDDKKKDISKISESFLSSIHQ